MKLTGTFLITIFYLERCNKAVMKMISHESEKPVTFTIVGDGMVGKTHICKTFAGKKTSQSYQATVNDEYTVSTEMIGNKYNIRILDTSGQVSHIECSICKKKISTWSDIKTLFFFILRRV